MKSLILNITEIPNSFQPENNKPFAVMDLANMFYSVPILTASRLQFALTSKKHDEFLPNCPWSISTALPTHTIFTLKNLTPFNFRQEHGYDITSMTSFSKEIHLTNSFKTYKTHTGALPEGDGPLTHA